MVINNIIFDLGAVLIDWNPRYLYRKLLKSEEEVTWFLENICTSEWNDKQDAGRSFEEATAELVSRFPEWELPIRAWYDRWEETINGQIEESVDILAQLKSSSQYRLFALTNWSESTFPWALQNFSFLSWFEGIVVSGVEKTRKPYPEIYQILFNRYKVDPRNTLFIDDNVKNIEGGKVVGLHTLHFTSPAQLRADLSAMKLL